MGLGRGAGAVQGDLSTTNNGSYAAAANEVFSFNIGATVNTLNAAYGAGNWTIANPALAFSSANAKQNNSRFGVGSGTFSIYWVANNNWAQSAGTSTDRQLNPVYASTAADLLAWAGTVADLGDETLTLPSASDQYLNLSYSFLSSDSNYSSFVSAITNPSTGAGGYPALSLYLMGTSETIGMVIFTGGQSQNLPTLSFDVVANVSATPNPLAFPGTAIGESSTQQTLTVTNASQAAWNVGTLALGGADASEFAVSTDACSGKTLSPGGTCTVTVVFSPASAGSKNAAITVPLSYTFNGQGYTTSFAAPLSGTGGVATVTVTPQPLDFGVVLLPDLNEGDDVPSGCTDNLNGTVSCGLTIKNTSSLTLSSVSLSTSGPFTVSPSTISSTLAPNATASAKVTYTATSGKNGIDTGVLTVYAGGDTASVDLTAATDTRPDTPVNALPLNATNVPLTPQLTASAFSDADGDTHASSKWEISTDSKFASGSTVFTSGNDANDLISLTVPTGVLQSAVTYYWRVTYTDSRGAPSDPSAATSFTTTSVAMNASRTTPLAMAVTDSAGSEVTSLSALSSAVAAGTASARLLADLGSSATVNSGDSANLSLPSVAIVKEGGGASSNVLGIVSPAGTNIVTATTTTTTDAAFNSAPPDSYAFPAGIASFTITGVSGSNNPATVTFYTPADLPANAVWYKYSPSRGWLLINSNGTWDSTGGILLSSATTFSVVNGKGVLSITDNDLTDFNPTAGIVLDPGGPAVPSTSAAATAAEGSSTGGNKCFIATAAYGSYFSPYVMILRNFRDTFLLTTRAGSAFVRWYYRVSPPIADTIRGSEALRACVRVGLVPAVGFSFLSLRAGIVPAILLSALLLLIVGMSAALCARRLLRRVRS